ncbi:putative collagen-binding domain of a collagenase [Phytophthora infestans]|uniref:Putative collagen-binding domain of a collagenase n=1 Tax=Phytophthora infestans TaxID=4787 RepID=A0A833SER3_PHYIN|nr:putative collagen-binding domain of a collagenase [Phytophthora infestans]
MKTEAAIAGLLSLAGVTGITSAEPSWHNLAITAPRYGRYLTRTVSEEPFFWQADTAWELVHRLNKTSIEFYLKLEPNKATTSSRPFCNSDPTQPNDAYFELVDWTVDLAASYGILMALVPTWGMYVNGGWHSTTPIFNESNAYDWGKYIGERYPGLPKLLGGDSEVMWSWNISEVQAAYAEDPDQDLPSLLAPIEDTSAVWASMNRGLKEAERAQGYESVVIYHPTAGWIVKPEVTPEAYGHNMLPNEQDRMSIDAVQSGYATPDPTSKFTTTFGWDSTNNYDLIANMRDRSTGPVIDLENHYEGAHDSFNLERQIWNSSQIRTGLYHGVYGGACGFTYGANSVWQMYEPRSALLRDNDCPSSHTGKSVNTYEGTRYISVLATKNRDRYYVYTGHGDSFALQLDNGSGARFGTARWFSPRDGQYYADAAISVLERGNATHIDFTPPSGGSIDDDWLLVLEF